MMKAFMTCLFLAVFCASSWLYAQHTFNGNLEDLDRNGKPIGWDLTYKNQNKYDVRLDSLIKRQGKYAISISSGNSNAQSGAIIFPIHQSFKGKRLTLVGSLKTENVTGGFAGIWLRVDGAGEEVLAFESMEKQGLKGTSDWKEYRVEVPYAEEDAVTINAGALLVGKGKIWVDSLRLYIDDQPIEAVPVKATPNYAASLDRQFEKGSGIDTIMLSSQNIKDLTLLGELWGFLKYHHPAVARGDYNWDAQLFRILPLILTCQNDAEASVVMEKWVDDLGKVPLCKSCQPLTAIKNVAVKPNYGSLFTNKVFSNLLVAKLQYILKNSDNASHYYVSVKPEAANPAFRHEKPYDKMKYPDAGYRLLSLYRYWSIIQYFSPNRNLIKEDWNKVLKDFISQVIAADQKNSYVRTMVKLISTTRDTHGFISSSVYDAYLGKYRLPFQARFIEDKLVVTGFYKDTLNVKANFRIGDVITAINGESTVSLVKKYMPLTSASNDGAALRDMPGTYLLRSNNALFKLDLLREGKDQTVDQQAAENSKINAYSYDGNPEPTAPGFKLIDKQIGYINCAKYKNTDLDSLKKQFKHTMGIIVDMRHYPGDEMENTLGNYFKSDSSGFVKFTMGSVKHPGLFTYGDELKNGEKNGDWYKGKVVVIVNERTQSNAEFVTMAFQSAAHVTVIGSTSAGADGNISEILLPGGITTWISGLGVYYPDGTNTQRTGVKIDQIVKPTIQGVKDGSDELLEKAEFLIREIRINDRADGPVQVNEISWK